VQTKAFQSVTFLQVEKVFETDYVSEMIWKSGSISLGVFSPSKLEPVNFITMFDGAVQGKGPQSSRFAHSGFGSIKNATELSVTLINLAFLKTWTGILSEEKGLTKKILYYFPHLVLLLKFSKIMLTNSVLMFQVPYDLIL